MTASNAAAARRRRWRGATGCTDVTGYGLLGHLMKMAAASGVDAVVDVAAVPVLTGVRELAESGIAPGGSRRNRDWVAPSLDAGGLGELDVLLLADAQTSGGLLFGAAPERARRRSRSWRPGARGGDRRGPGWIGADRVALAGSADAIPAVAADAASGRCSKVALLQRDRSRATLLQSRRPRDPPDRLLPLRRSGRPRPVLPRDAPVIGCTRSVTELPMLTRRGFLARAAAGVVLVGAGQVLLTAPNAAAAPVVPGYGLLRDDPDGLLALPPASPTGS